MSTVKAQEKKTGQNKKATRKEISTQLVSVLAGLKETLGEKKFERRIKKAARLLTAGIKTKPIKKEKKGKGKTNRIKIKKSTKPQQAVAE
jgi:hypothetical protein